MGLIFAECHINYRSPAYFDERIRTHLRPAQLRRSSFRMEFRMVSEADGRLLAEGWGALVGYDYTTAGAAPLPGVLVEALRAQGVEPESAEGRDDGRGRTRHRHSMPTCPV